MEARDVQALRETLDQLRDEVAELRASRQRLVLAADADRREIERVLHAGVQQHLVALSVNLQHAGRLTSSDPAMASELIAQIGRDVQQALEETAQLAQRIYPPLLDARGLGAALRSAAAGKRASTRIDVAGGASYAPELAAAAYFSILDVLGHASKNSRVTVTIREEDGSLVFEVAEEEPCSTRSEAELDRLRDRVEALGGHLTIAAEPGRGVRISGWFPRTG